MSDDQARQAKETAASWSSRLIPPNPWLSMLVVLVVLLAAILLFPYANGVPDATELGDIGVFLVAALALTLAGWRFTTLEDTQADAAKSLADAAQKQATAAEKQIKVALTQAAAAQEQNVLAAKQLKGSEDLAKAANRQGDLAQKQADAADKLASAAESQANTAKELAAAAKQQVQAAAKAAEAAKQHADAANKRAATNDEALLLDRYHRAARMLGDRVQAVRIGGICLLDRLARDQAEKYHVEVMTLFASFVRNQADTPAGGAGVDDRRLRADVQAVIKAIGSRDEERRQCERDKRFELTLTRANLRDADLREANLQSVNLEDVRLEGADLTDARLDGARIAGARLAGPNHEGCVLTQAQLDSCSGGPTDGPDGLNRIPLEWKPATQVQ